jgi:hypothetical protein
MTEIYRNLHRKDWSIRNKGIVTQHTKTTAISPAKFVVQPAGRKKVLKEQRKNVHAFIRGQVTDIPPNWQTWKQVKYNPYLFDHFYDVDTLKRIDTATVVVLAEDGSAYYQ